MKEVICVVCPKGCHIQVETINNELVMTQNGCARGPIYVKQELIAPKRSLSTTVQLIGGIERRLPIVSSDDLPKEIIFDVQKILAEIKVEAPIKVGQIIVENVLGTGVHMIAAKSIKKRSS